MSIRAPSKGNNIAGSLAEACASVGMNFTIASPRDYRIPDMVWAEAERRAAVAESRVSWVERPAEAVRGADVVYTDVWISMGQESEKAERMRVFSDYQVNEGLIAGAKSDAVFMHDMPAHRGEEISDGMLEHASSVVFDQAENRLHAQNAILTELFSR